MLNLNGLQQWKCKHGHVLGVIERVKVSDAGRKRWATRLLLFRQAIDLEQVESGTGLTDVDVVASVEGTTLDVKCSVPGCCEMRSWFIGSEGLERILKQASGSDRAVAG